MLRNVPLNTSVQGATGAPVETHEPTEMADGVLIFPSTGQQLIDCPSCDGSGST